MDICDLAAASVLQEASSLESTLLRFASGSGLLVESDPAIRTSSSSWSFGWAVEGVVPGHDCVLKLSSLQRSRLVSRSFKRSNASGSFPIL